MEDAQAVSNGLVQTAARRLQLSLTAIIVATSSLPVVWLVATGRVHAATLLVLVAVAYPIYFLCGRLIAPVCELMHVSQQLSSGQLGARALVAGNSPWHLIAAALHHLAGKLTATSQHLEAQVAARTAELERKAAQLRTVGVVGRQVASVLEPDRLEQFVVRLMRGAFGYDVVALLKRHGPTLIVTACAARDVEDPPIGKAFPASGPQAPPLTTDSSVTTSALDMPDTPGIPGIQIMPGTPSAATTSSTASSTVSPIVAQLNMASELAVPIKVGDQTLGVLVVQSAKPHAFDAEDRFVVETIAGQIAVAYENARLLETERHLRSLAITEERHRMAREIHDTMAQGFMGIIMLLRALGEDDLSSTQLSLVQQAENLARENLKEARRSIWNLRPEPLETMGLKSSIAHELSRLEKQFALTTSFHEQGDDAILPQATQMALYRIAQESLRNAVEHGHATHLDVKIDITRTEATLVITDNGVGFEPDVNCHNNDQSKHESNSLQPGRGLGLKSMKERANQLGGEFVIQSAPGAGCSVNVCIPIERGL